MKLEGLHHVTMITADAQATVDFYAGTLGLRLVKKTVNFDSPDAYHLYFGDETGAAGSILTWFEFAAPRAAAPASGWSTGSSSASPRTRRWTSGPRAWRPRERDSARCASPTRTGSRSSWSSPTSATRRCRPSIPRSGRARDHRRRGCPRLQRVRPGRRGLLTDVLGLRARGRGRVPARRAAARFRWAYDPAPAYAGRQGAGTVHHIAWASRDEDHLAWQERIAGADGYVTEVRDRDYFRSIYFREPRGVLFEIATLSPGFAVDEDPEHLGEALKLPAQHEHLREQLERALTPVVNPRARGGRMSALIHRERPADGDPAGLVVLHHGRGADEHDLLGLADVLDPERRLHVVTPRAPLQLPGWPGNHWYVVPRVGYPDHDTFHAAFGALASLHDELWEKTGIAPERTVFGGFSMGSVMSYALGLAGYAARARRGVGVLGLHPDRRRLAALARRPHATRVFIAHGRQDPIMDVRSRGAPRSCSRPAAWTSRITRATPPITSTRRTCRRQSTGCARRCRRERGARYRAGVSRPPRGARRASRASPAGGPGARPPRARPRRSPASPPR